MERGQSIRRRAESNYIRTNHEPALVHLESSFRGAQAFQAHDEYAAYNDDERASTPPTGQAPPTTDIFAVLQAKFGFQASAVANQKEHFVYWLTNYQLRVQHESETRHLSDADATRIALMRVHVKFFKNYVRWCKFLRTEPYVAPETVAALKKGRRASQQPPMSDANTTLMMEKQLALFLLIWGEAGNMRFMPECICFLYHSMANKLNEVEYLPNVEEGFYLKTIIRPIYGVISTMRTSVAPEGAKPLDHADVTNYDDVNEFFWTPACLDFDELNVAEALKVHDPKTFKEKRSVFNPLLAFFRIWFFLIVMFHIMVVFVYVAYRADNGASSGLKFYGNFFTTSQSDIRAHAIYSIFITISALLMMKVILQVWLHGLRIFKNTWLMIGVFCRMFWHTFFFALFLLVGMSPAESALFGSASSILSGGGDAGTFLSMGLLYMIVYCIPVLFAAFLRMFFARAVWGIRILNGMDGTRRQYIGRHMAQPWAAYSQYALSWLVIFLCKFLFNLQFMIKPLVGPSIVVYDIVTSDSNGIIKSNHNILFIVALWIPVFVVYMYDSQIYFILYQTIVGLVMGVRMKLGHYIDLEPLKVGLYSAPKQFDERITSTLAKTAQQGSAPLKENGEIDHVCLRFAIIWNEVISNFRLNDLLDDRETVMLQYRILGKGEHVEVPIFLLAGSLTKAITMTSTASANKWSTQTIVKNLESASILDGVQDGLYLLREIFTLLLGDSDDPNGATSVLEYIYSSPDIASLLDFTHLPELSEQIVELLGRVLDMPEDIASIEGNDAETQGLRLEFQVQVGEVVQCVRDTFKIVGKMLNDASLSRKLDACRFLQFTPDFAFQKQQLLSLYKADVMLQNGFFSAHRRENDESYASSSRFAREDFISGCTRLFILLRLDVANSLPRSPEAKRRMGFFLHSLNMHMPEVTSLEAMPSFSVMTPYYSETVLFTLEELKDPVHSNPLFEALDKKATTKGRGELSIMRYLITQHAEEWSNFLERMGVATLEEALADVPMQVRLWASLRGQTLARTVQGMMMYEDAIRLLRWLELYAVADMNETTKANEMSRISALKFSYITGCQIYSQQVAKGDHRADDIDFLMKKYPSWRVSFVDTIKGSDTTRYDCVLVKSENNEIVEVYRYELPGNPILGEGKPENQNVALPFTRGEYLQTIDMNQEHYFEETLKMPNFLATATSNGEDVTIIGMKEHVFTGRASSLASFMTLQELVFVTLTQRVLATPLRARMHYGHPDVFEKSFVITSGGVSKASKGINLSEDVFSGYNVTLRGGLVTHVEFMQCGKGRDVTLSQINAFEAKLSNGCAESCLSREGHRLSNNLDFFRLNSMFFGHFGFYICNALTVLCVYIYAYAKLYVATHEDIEVSAVMASNSLSSLSTVMSTQYILQFGMLTTLPLLATLYVEFGFKQAAMRVVELISTLGIVFYVFLTGTKAHFYDVALIRGGSKYRGTGRGFGITRDPMVNFFKEYNVSHFRKAVELVGVMILFGICGNFNIGQDALSDYCSTSAFDCDDEPDLIPANITSLQAYSATPQSYGLASFAVLLLGACWLMAPFLFNTDGLVLQKTNIDVANWFAWMMRVKRDDDLIDQDAHSSLTGTPKDGWLEWWKEDVDLMLNLGGMGRILYCLRELRHPLAMYYVFTTQFSLTDMIWLIIVIAAVWAALCAGDLVNNSTIGRKQKLQLLTVRGIVYMLVVVCGLMIAPIIIGGIAGWSVNKALVLASAIFLGLNSICQFALALHGFYGFRLAMTRPVIALGFLFDMLVGFFLVVPLIALSFLPFMRILQTRMLYNGGFSRALSSGSEVAASLVIILGLVAGFVHGFMTCFIAALGYVNDSSDNFVNQSFYYFVTHALSDSESSQLLNWMQKGYLKTACAGASVAAVLINLVLSRFFGRRWSMVSGTLCIVASMVLNFIESKVTIILACTLTAAGLAVLTMNYMLYSFEICTKGWRGKSVVMFLLGSMFGYLVHAIMQANLDAKVMTSTNTSKSYNDNWRMLPLYVVAPVIIVLGIVLKVIPESPVWLLRNKHTEHAKRVLARLRQRENVQQDVALIEEELNGSATKGINLPFRISFVFVLQIMVGIVMSHGLLYRQQLKETSSSTDGSRYSLWFEYYAICSASGLAFGVFLVDNVRRKTLLKEFLPCLAILSFFCGVIASATSDHGKVLQGLLLVLYIATGLSLLSVAWLSSMEMFPASQRPILFSLSLCVFYLTEGVVFLTTPSFAAMHFIFGALCALMTVVLFMFCASTKIGTIQLKGEKKAEKENQALADAAAIVAAGVNDIHEHGENQLQIRRQQSRFAVGAGGNQSSRRLPYVSQSTLDSTSSSDNVNIQTFTSTSMNNVSQSFHDDSSESNVTQSPRGGSYVPQRSGSIDLIDEFDALDSSRSAHGAEVSYPVQQPRSQSFLRSQSYPDADETMYRRL
uniref:1,3-beta-glucan synthase n=1 Tax=Globisporangium ultimum (strain ATCC 200006 / CBS 805.95 / DAOM BR144) TaxID=431595 RepID=K3WVE6_GLOUD